MNRGIQSGGTLTPCRTRSARSELKKVTKYRFRRGGTSSVISTRWLGPSQIGNAAQERHRPSLRSRIVVVGSCPRCGTLKGSRGAIHDSFVSVRVGGPGGTRTHDRQLSRKLLYPLSYGARSQPLHRATAGPLYHQLPQRFYARPIAARRSRDANCARPSSRWLYRHAYSFRYPSRYFAETEWYTPPSPRFTSDQKPSMVLV